MRLVCASAQTDPSARALIRLAPGRFVQASITSDGGLHWLKVHGAGDLDGALADDAHSDASIAALAVSRLSRN